MQQFRSFDGTEIAYIDTHAGAGAPVLLLHGFAADHRVNWVAPGVVRALVEAGHRVIAADARGHGASEKPVDPARYADDAMVRDARALLDHLSVDEVHVVGYSMGSMVASRLVPSEPRSRSLVLGGVGDALATRRAAVDRGRIADALLADDPATIDDPVARDFRNFADRTSADRHALAAIQRSSSKQSRPRFDAIAVPVLVLAGDRDGLLGSAAGLARRMSDARLCIVPGNHLTAVGGPAFRRAIVDFLAEVQRG